MSQLPLQHTAACIGNGARWRLPQVAFAWPDGSAPPGTSLFAHLRYSLTFCDPERAKMWPRCSRGAAALWLLALMTVCTRQVTAIKAMAACKRAAGPPAATAAGKAVGV